MKKVSVVKVFILCVLISMMTACISSRQETTVGDARSVVANLPDFKRQVQYLRVDAVKFGFPIQNPWPRLYESFPKLADDKTDFVHEVIYQTKSGALKLVLLNDAQPPKIVGGRELK